MNELNSSLQVQTDYVDDDIKTLEWREHIRLRPEMYIGAQSDKFAPFQRFYIIINIVCLNLQR